MNFDKSGEGRQALRDMPKLMRTHLMVRLLQLLDNYEHSPNNRNEAYLKIGIYECPVGRFVSKEMDEADRFGTATVTQRAVVECLLGVGLEHGYIQREENQIPYTYKLTEKGKGTLKVRAATRSSVIGSLIVEKSRNASAGG